jgi:hypothetical protein
MAVMFIISYNVALDHAEEEDSEPEDPKKKKKNWEVYGEKKEEVKSGIGRGGISGK